MGDGLGGVSWRWGVGWGVGSGLGVGGLGEKCGVPGESLKRLNYQFGFFSYNFPYYTQIFRIHIKMALFYRKSS